MKISLKATSIVEAMVAMMIISLGVTGMFTIYTKSMRLSETTANKIQAVQIAREGIEAMFNIRDTNWVLFSSDIVNCWNSENYENRCIGDASSDDIDHNQAYLIYKKSNNRWFLESTTDANTSKNRIWLDDDSFYTHSGAYTGYAGSLYELKPLFTRVIKVNYIDTGEGAGDTDNQKMNVTSTVEWLDKSSSQPHRVVLESVLSNWKK